MFLRRLELANIRSYKKETITFETDTTLLCGDIGSGKTTILLAIEYALFGILRGKTSPQELLRHDAREGKVILEFEVQSKQVAITRTLKRSGKNILQGPGVLVINGEEEQLVATELKARILGLLGYPESLLSRSTNLFRYTVYTPQEQVKLILQESVEERKDIIRKIFGIDKYKRVAENTQYYTTDLRERTQRLQGQTDDLKTLKEQFSSQQKELDVLTKRLAPATKEAQEIKEKRIKTEKLLDKLATEQKTLQELNQRHKLKEQELAATQHALADIDKRIKARTDHNAYELKAIKDIKEVKEVKDETKRKLKEIFARLQEKKSLLSKKQGEVQARKKQATHMTEQISRLTTCPVCKQNVSDDHKDHIAKEQQKILSQVKEKQAHYAKVARTFHDKEKDLVEKQERLAKQEQEFIRFQEAQKRQLLHEKENEQLIKDKQTLEKKKNELDKQLKNIARELQAKKKDMVQDGPLKEELLTLRKAEREKDLALQELKTRHSVATNMHATLKQAIAEKEAVHKRIEKLSTIKHWVQELFIPLVKTIEKRVLQQVYKEFNEYFVNWFGMLVQDDTLTVRLDQDFTPLIEQNGYDTNLTNLSGGEKTSLALAYRLALNKVLNDYFSTLHTKGLLILDEPTDGFSTEQVDTLRDVLEQAGVNQLIIVSHEQRLESLAQHVLRIEKSAQESLVLTT